MKWSNADFSPLVAEYSATSEDGVLFDEASALARIQITADDINDDVNQRCTRGIALYEHLNEFTFSWYALAFPHSDSLLNNTMPAPVPAHD
jgi:hypothetical protein